MVRLHANPKTTHRYVETDLAMMEKALAQREASDTKMGNFRAPDSLERFVQVLKLCKERTVT